MLRHILVLIILISSQSYANNMRGPNVLKKQQNHITRNSNLSAQYGYTFLKLYQARLGKFIKSSCPMQPSCSNYSIEAVSQYGLIYGVILTADRLLHETDEAIMVKKIWIKGRGHCALDPVSRNVIWTEQTVYRSTYKTNK